MLILSCQKYILTPPTVKNVKNLRQQQIKPRTQLPKQMDTDKMPTMVLTQGASVGETENCLSLTGPMFTNLSVHRLCTHR